MLTLYEYLVYVLEHTTLHPQKIRINQKTSTLLLILKEYWEALFGSFPPSECPTQSLATLVPTLEGNFILISPRQLTYEAQIN